MLIQKPDGKSLPEVDRKEEDEVVGTCDPYRGNEKLTQSFDTET
jgi:hypothetical protein